MGQFLDYAGEPVPNDADVVVILDGDTGVTKYMTRANFFKDMPLVDGQIPVAQINPSIETVATPATLNFDPLVRMYIVSNLANTLLFGVPLAGFYDGQTVMVRIKDNGVARTLNYTTDFVEVGVTKPTATQGGTLKWTYIMFAWNAQGDRFDILSVARSA